VHPDSVRTVSGCMAYAARGTGANVPRTSVNLLVPVLGFLKPDTSCIVLTLLKAVIQDAVIGGEINARTGMTMGLAYGSGFKA